MNQRVRSCLVVLGGAFVASWVALALFRLALPAELLAGGSVVREGAEARRHAALDPVLYALPQVVAAGLAGVLVGYASEGGKLWSWATAFAAVVFLFFFGPSLAAGRAFSGTLGHIVPPGQMIATCAFAIAGVWLGRRLRDHGTVA